MPWQRQLLIKFVDGNIGKGAADALEVRAATQRYPEKLEGWADRNLSKFNMDSCKALHTARKVSFKNTHGTWLARGMKRRT